MNKNSVDALTTDIATELACKHRRAEVTSAAKADRVCQKNKQNGMRASDICLVSGGVTGDTVLNVMTEIRDEKEKDEESTENNRAEIAATKAADIAK